MSSSSVSSGNDNRRFADDDFNNGIADRKIREAIIIEARGSTKFQPVILTTIVEMMTPTDPSVSAMICRKIPCILSSS